MFSQILRKLIFLYNSFIYLSDKLVFFKILGTIYTLNFTIKIGKVLHKLILLSLYMLVIVSFFAK
jgi:hypothetical protein